MHEQHQRIGHSFQKLVLFLVPLTKKRTFHSVKVLWEKVNKVQFKVHQKMNYSLFCLFLHSLKKNPYILLCIHILRFFGIKNNYEKSKII